MAHLYQFDTKTGFIGGWASSAQSIPDEAVGQAKDGVVMFNDQLKASVTYTDSNGKQTTSPQLIESGWTFVLDAQGKFTFDEQGNYQMLPPPVEVPEPDVATYLLLAAIKSGQLDPATDIHKGLVDAMNLTLDKAGVPIIPGTELCPVPTRTAVCLSKPPA